MPAISVIVPVYNVEPYLHRCVDSILNQTYTDFELILVDDGSPDNCPAICDEYAARDRRVRVIHKENGGVSSARNAGLDIAQGEYITFVDSDDWVVDTYLADMMLSTADLVCQTAVRLNEDGTVIARNHLNEKTVAATLENIIMLLQEGSFNWASCKRFRGEIINTYHIRFEETIDFAEDTLFTVQYAKCCRRICVEDAANYRYTIYRSRKTLSDLQDDSGLYKHLKANRLISQAACGENRELTSQVYAERMYAPYEYYIERMIISPTVKNKIKIQNLLSLSDNSDFMEMLENTKGRFSAPGLRKAIYKKSRLLVLFSILYRNGAKRGRELIAHIGRKQ